VVEPGRPRKPFDVALFTLDICGKTIQHPDAVARRGADWEGVVANNDPQESTPAADAKAPKRFAFLPTKAQAILIAFLASVIIILEGRFHEFDALDETVLSIARSYKVFEHPDLNGKSPKEGCQASSKYVALIVSRDAPQDAPGTRPLWRRAFATVAKLQPSVLAFDLDATTITSVADILEFDTQQRSQLLPDSSTTRMVVIANARLENQDAKTRSTRNAWLRGACQTRRVAVASPAVNPSQRTGAVLQFYGDRIVETGTSPSAYPSLGQLVHKLKKGMEPRNSEAGPGFICQQLADPLAESDVRIPFLDPAFTLAEQSDPGFLAEKHPGDLYSVEWINPYRLDKDITVLAIRNQQDIDALQSNPSCIKDRVVLLGGETQNAQMDAFRTLAGDETPGVVVHAMVARSQERILKSALSLNALLDLVVGYVLTALAEKAFPHLRRSDAFSVRLVGNVLRILLPLFVIAVVLLIAWAALSVGFFLNPLVVAFGMWLHGIVEAIAKKSSTPDDAGKAAEKVGVENAGAGKGAAVLDRLNAWWAKANATPLIGHVLRWLPAPQMSGRAIWQILDRFVYVGLLCVMTCSIVYAVYLVGTRITILLS